MPHNWLTMVKHAPCLKTLNLKLPSLKCMPQIHNILNDHANLLHKTRLDLGSNPTNLVKIGWRSYGSSLFQFAIQNVQIWHFVPLGAYYSLLIVTFIQECRIYSKTLLLLQNLYRYKKRVFKRLKEDTIRCYWLIPKY